MVQRSARGSLILVVGQISSTVISALGAILVARFLGSKSYGQVALVMIPVSIIALFRDLGVTNALVRYIAQYRAEGKISDINTLVRAGLFINSAVGAVLSLVTFLLAGPLAVSLLHQPGLDLIIKVASADLIAHNLLLTSQAIFVGYERMEFRSLMVILYSLLKSAAAPILVFFGYGAFGAVLGNVSSLVITGAIGVMTVAVVFLRDSSYRGGDLSISEASKLLLVYGYPLFLSALFAGSLSQFYNFLIAVYTDAFTVGNYKAATNFFVLIAFLTLPISTVLFPLFSKLEETDSSTLRLVFQNSVKYSSLITVPVTSAMIVLADQLVQAAYGNGYELAPMFLRLFVFNSLFVGIGNLSIDNFLNGQGRTRVTFLKSLSTMCIGVSLGLALAPRLGIIGLLLTMIIAPKTGQIYSLIRLRKDFGFTVNWTASVKIYISSGISSLTTYLLQAFINYGIWVDLLIGGFAFLLVYILVVATIGTLERNDLQNLRNIIGSIGPFTPFFRVIITMIEKLMDKTRPQGRP